MMTDKINGYAATVAQPISTNGNVENSVVTSDEVQVLIEKLELFQFQSTDAELWVALSGDWSKKLRKDAVLLTAEQEAQIQDDKQWLLDIQYKQMDACQPFLTTNEDMLREYNQAKMLAANIEALCVPSLHAYVYGPSFLNNFVKYCKLVFGICLSAAAILGLLVFFGRMFLYWDYFTVFDCSFYPILIITCFTIGSFMTYTTWFHEYLPLIRMRDFVNKLTEFRTQNTRENYLRFADPRCGGLSLQPQQCINLEVLGVIRKVKGMNMNNNHMTMNYSSTTPNQFLVPTSNSPSANQSGDTSNKKPDNIGTSYRRAPVKELLPKMTLQ